MSAVQPAKLLEPCRGGRQTTQRAWTTLERCRRRLSLEELPLPIPVEEWIEGPLGIQFGFSDLSHLGDGVLGAAFFDGPEIMIDEQVLEHEGRCRFTCAHELGHVVMHKRVRDSFHDTKADVTFSTNKYERQADCFAAAFLMPLPPLERVIVRSFDDRRLKRATCMYELMQSTAESEWLWRYRVLPAITRAFNVSLSAAAFRCAEIQPRITNPQPLMPRRLIRRMLVPAKPDDNVTAVQVIDGRPQYRDLFTVEGEAS
jgi:Zn-dependent peptidase ImmA (M78 family)